MGKVNLTGADELESGEAGVTLLEIVCVLAVIAFVGLIALPALPRGTSGPRLEGYALEVASLLKQDRIAAMRLGRRVAVAIDGRSGTIRSGASARSVALPPDVKLGAVLAATCAGRADAAATIDFFPTGMSCGGTVSLAAIGRAIQVRVNWLTGDVDIAFAAAI